MSDHIGNLYYSDARAVQIAGKYIEGGAPDDKTPHSAVHGDFNILTNSAKEAQALIAAWPRLMQRLSESAEEILDEVRYYPKPETG